MIPGEIITKDRDIELNKGKHPVKVTVDNTGDRPVQVGSHFHFFEVNKLLKFSRKLTYGMRLNIASGTSVRFEPGETKTVELIEMGGRNRVFGLNALTNGAINDDNIKKSVEKAKTQGFIGKEVK